MEVRHFRSSQAHMYMTASKDMLTCSRLTDSSENFHCPFCGSSFSTRAFYQKHLNTLHREEKALPYICSICQKGFFSMTGLRHHLEAHKGWQFGCTICDARFQHKHNLRRHIEGVHKMRECRGCFKLFPIGPDYNKHVLSCSG